MVLLCYPLTFSGFAVPANLFSLLFIVVQGVSAFSFSQNDIKITSNNIFLSDFLLFCQLPACIFLSSVLGRLTDVETIRCFLNAYTICFYLEMYKLQQVAQLFYIALPLFERLEVQVLLYLFCNSQFACTPCNRHGYLFYIANLTMYYTYKVLYMGGCFIRFLLYIYFFVYIIKIYRAFYISI